MQLTFMVVRNFYGSSYVGFREGCKRAPDWGDGVQIKMWCLKIYWYSIRLVEKSIKKWTLEKQPCLQILGISQFYTSMLKNPVSKANWLHKYFELGNQSRMIQKAE